VLPDMFPRIQEMIENKKVGIYNFVNGGLISPEQIIRITEPSIQPETIRTDSKPISIELSTKKLEKNVSFVTSVTTALANMVANLTPYIAR
jgi:hypothetical protein